MPFMKTILIFVSMQILNLEAESAGKEQTCQPKDNVSPTPTTESTSQQSIYQKISWKQIGPGGGGSSFLSKGSPHDSQIAFVAADVGPMYKTVNGGKSWYPVTGGYAGYYQPLWARNMKFSDTNPKQIWCWGFRGLFESNDEGETWSCLSENFPPAKGMRNNMIAAVAIDTSNADVIYAAPGIFSMFGNGPGEIYKSVNHGKSWKKLSTNMPEEAFVTSIEVDPANKNNVYASTAKGFFMSADGGKTWAQKGLDVFPDGCGTMTICKNPENGKTLLFVVSDAKSPDGKTYKNAVYMSDDGGEHWIEKSNGIKASQKENKRFFIICNAGMDSGLLFLGSRQEGTGLIYASSDFGEHWTDMSNSKITKGWGWVARPAFDISVCNSNPNVIYIAMRGTCIKSDDGGKSWNQFSSVQTPDGKWKGTGHEVTFINKIVIDPFDSRKLYIASNDIGLFMSDDGGESFSFVFPFGEGKYGTIYDAVVADPDVKDSVYVGYEIVWDSSHKFDGSIICSRDGGKSWSLIGTKGSGLSHPPIENLKKYREWNGYRPINGTSSIAIDRKSPKENRTIYAGSIMGGIFKSSNGKSWKKISRNFDERIVQLAINPENSSVLYAAVRSVLGQGGEIRPGGLFISKDAGVNWNRVQGMPDVDVTGIAMSEKYPEIIYVSCWRNEDAYTANPANKNYSENNKGGIYRSDDGGLSWKRILNEPQCRGLDMDKNNPDIVFAGSSEDRNSSITKSPGIFFSEDGGKTWTRVNDGLNTYAIQSITVDSENPGSIFIGTRGGGFLKSQPHP
ncbi:MAG: hypothetical protein A2017_21740 [Lentisphaerae bacterium GWF2_44_16]|nr:MAG: hypothetical protein A2017_21740 [Lentisphaerae bacterium GWF2_44_16]